MGRQTSFYAHPDDYPSLAAGLQSVGAVAMDRQSRTGQPVISNIAASGGPIMVLLTGREFLGSLHARYSDHQQAWIYSVADDPVVELDVWRPYERVLRPGRVYFTTRSLVGDEADLAFEDKPTEFIAFAERVRRWIRRWCQRRDGLLLAPSLATRFDYGKLTRKGIQGELELLS